MPFDPEYGLVAVFGLVLAQQLGAPIPAWPALMLSGAYAYTAGDPIHAVAALSLATAGSVMGSLPWLWAGRRYGHGALRLACRVSLSPDACVHQTETLIERYGAAALLASKFVPGLGRVAPPLAGAFRLRLTRFVSYFGAGSALGALVPLAIGAAFHAQIEDMIAWVSAFGGHAVAGIGTACVLYAAYLWQVRRRLAASPSVARNDASEIPETSVHGQHRS